MAATSPQLLLHQCHGPTRSKLWSLRNIMHLLSSQEVTCEQLVRHCHATAVAGEDIWKLRAFSRLLSWQQLQEEAQASDDRRRAGVAKSSLDGIPISVKANLAVRQQALTAGSPILGESATSTVPPAVGYNADLVHFLVEECGAICIGITNMDEFGMGSLGTNVVEGSTKNPLSYYFPEDTTISKEILDSQNSLTSLIHCLKQSTEEISECHGKYVDHNHGHYSAGGSSCGAAASIAHGSSLIALGSDTGGSIRLPAAWCGVVGMKTSYGRISRHGLVSYASSLDTVGFLTPTVDCAYLVMAETLMSQQGLSNPKDSNSMHYSVATKEPEPKMLTGELPLNGIKIGIPSAFVVEECPQDVKDVWSEGAAALEQAGATLSVVSSESISPELIQSSLAAYYVLTSAEASSNLGRYDGFRYGIAAYMTDRDTMEGRDNNVALGEEEEKMLQRQYASTRTQGFGSEVIRRILCGTAVLSSDKFHTHYEAAAKLRALLTQQLEAALNDNVDYLLIPTAISPPPCLDTKEENSGSNFNATEMFANDIMTVPISLAGLTAVGVPFYGKEGGPSLHNITGLQLVGRRLDEANLLRVARYLEDSSVAK